jgi:hypothetical protein
LSGSVAEHKLEDVPKRKKRRDPVGEQPEEDVAERIAAILRFARFEGPTGDIDELLADIERGRELPL